MSWLFRIRKIWQLYGPRRRLIIINGDTPPETIPTRHIYLCREEGENWSISMSCPCGCQDKLELMLLKEVKPNWTLKSKDQDPPTVYPSIWRQAGCGAHFWLRNGQIHWC